MGKIIFIMKKIVLFLSFIIFTTSCGNKDNAIEKHPKFSKNIVDISKNIVELKIDLLLGQSDLRIVGDHLLVHDIFSIDEGFHFFDKKSFKYIGSGGKKGQGPGEIINYRNINIILNEDDYSSFFVYDYSQLALYEYSIDKLLRNELYIPDKILNTNMTQVLDNIAPINDSIFLGMAFQVVGSSSFVNRVVKFNVKTGKMVDFGYQHPKIKEFGGKNTHSFFAISKNKNRYIQSFYYQDMMTICDVNGELVCNVYGSKWDGRKEKKFDKTYFGKLQVFNNYIIVDYNGGNHWVLDEGQRPRSIYPSKFLVFDLNGNYLKTLDVGEEVRFFCLDEETKRLFLSFRNRDVLAYVDLNGVLD